jgi:hypothetical protein
MPSEFNVKMGEQAVYCVIGDELTAFAMASN